MGISEQVVKPARELSVFFGQNGTEGDFAMDQQNISLMIGFFVLIGIRYLFLYVWRTKRVSRLRKRARRRFFPSKRDDRLYLFCSGLCFPVGPRNLRAGGKGRCQPDGSAARISGGL